jgi:hypothetical protein
VLQYEGCQITRSFIVPSDAPEPEPRLLSNHPRALQSLRSANHRPPSTQTSLAETKVGPQILQLIHKNIKYDCPGSCSNYNSKKHVTLFGILYYVCCGDVMYKKKTKLHGLSPRANYTDRATATCRRSDCQLFAPRGQRDRSLRPYSRFSRQEPLLFYQVAPQLYSRG